VVQVAERAATASQIQVHHHVVVVGGGNGGISVAARLLRAARGTDVAIIEPSSMHYYQPLWTLVGGGDARKEATQRSEASVIPKGAKWIHDAAAEFCPEENAVLTASGTKVGYDFLVVAPGMQLNWGAITGLQEAIGKEGVCSNYSYEYVGKTWEFIRNFKGGTAIFTHPNTPIKCGGGASEDRLPGRRRFPQAGRARQDDDRVRLGECQHLPGGEVREDAAAGDRTQRHRRALSN